MWFVQEYSVGFALPLDFIWLKVRVHNSSVSWVGRECLSESSFILMFEDICCIFNICI